MHRTKDGCRSASHETSSSSEDDPDKDSHLRFAGRRIMLLRANFADRPRTSRSERIRQIREQIRKGEYESEEKLNIAIDRLIHDVLRRRPQD